MNLLNLSTVLSDDVRLRDISIGQKLLDKLYNDIPGFPEIIDIDSTGNDIAFILSSLTGRLKDTIDTYTIVTMLESQIVIHDVTMFRQSKVYYDMKKDKLPTAVLLVMIAFGSLILLYYLSYYVYLLKAGGEELHGVVYDILLVIFKMLKPFVF